LAAPATRLSTAAVETLSTSRREQRAHTDMHQPVRRVEIGEGGWVAQRGRARSAGVTTQVYFNESAELAQQVTNECLALWAELLESVDADLKGQLLRSNGLKMEQLKAESKQLEHAHDD
jgi:hypothetical protein